MKNIVKNTAIYCCFVLLLAVSACEKADKTGDATTQSTQAPKKYHDTFAGIGFLTLKDEALAQNDTQFEFFEDKGITQPFGNFDFKTGKASNEEITPEFFRKEDDVCYFRCIGWDRERYYIYTNTLLESLRYVPVDTNKYRFVQWENFIANIPQITRLNPKDNHVKTRPSFKASDAEWDDLSSNVFLMKEVYKKWAKVTDVSGNQEGWILWVDKDRILVKFDKNDVKALNQLKLDADPSANPLNFETVK